MKYLKYIIFNTIIISICSSVYATDTLNFELHFNIEDFFIKCDSNNILDIKTDLVDYFFEENDSTPALPWYSFSILLNPKEEMGEYLISISELTLVSNNAFVYKNQLPQNENTTANLNRIVYIGNNYPQKHIEFSSFNIHKGNKIANFNICPFLLNSQNNKLYFVNKFTLKILTKTNDRIIIPSIPIPDFYKLTINPNQINNYQHSYYPFINNTKESYDYLIITTENLKSEFKKLKNWKTIKGVKTKIVTTEHIDTSSVYGDTKAEKIKSYIRNQFYHCGIKWVLLGGDDSIIPVIKTQMSIPTKNGTSTADIPSDLYYSCFDNCFSWDADNNGSFSDKKDYDERDLSPEVYLSRLPIKDKNSVKNYVEKVLNYELCNTNDITRFNYFLFTGARLHKTIEGKSDVHYVGDKIFSEHINPYCNSVKHNFYDTGSSFNGNENYELNANNLANIINKNYHLIQVCSHGNNSYYVLENGAFWTSDLNKLKDNNFYSHYITNACNTAWFDSDEECLAEALLSTQNKGAITYYGTSRTNWDSEYNSTSIKYIINFYKYLFKENIQNFAKITTFAKIDMLKQCKFKSTNLWTQYALNPLGDPELPIYTTNPNKFDNIEININDQKLYINTGIDNTKITITSYTDYGESYYKTYNNTKEVSISTTNLPQKYFIVITKNNYVPFIYTHIGNIIQNKIISNNITISTNQNIFIGYDVNLLEKQGPVILKSNSKLTIDSSSEVILKNDITIEKGAELNIK